MLQVFDMDLNVHSFSGYSGFRSKIKTQDKIPIFKNLKDHNPQASLHCLHHDLIFKVIL